MMKYQMALASYDQDQTRAVVPEDGWLVEEIGALPVAATGTRSDRLFGVLVGVLAGVASIAWVTSSLGPEDARPSTAPAREAIAEAPASPVAPASVRLTAPAEDAKVVGAIEVTGTAQDVEGRLRVAVRMGDRVVASADVDTGGGAFAASLSVLAGPFPVPADVLVTRPPGDVVLARRTVVVQPSPAVGLLAVSASQPDVIHVAGHAPAGTTIRIRVESSDGAVLAEGSATSRPSEGWAGLLLDETPFDADLPISVRAGETVALELAWTDRAGLGHVASRILVVPPPPGMP